MTLVITMLAQNKMVQVADTRLTLLGREYDANAIKSVCVRCEDAYFTIGFSGLAEIKGQRLDLWLVDQIKHLMSGGLHGSKQIVEKLVDQLDIEVPALTFRRTPVEKQYKGLLLSIAGFQHDLKGRKTFALPFWVAVSNIERWDLMEPVEVAERFTCKPFALRAAVPGAGTARRDTEPVYIVNGERSALFGNDKHASQTKAKLDRALRTLKRIDQDSASDAKASATCLAEVIQHASRHPKYGKLIGPRCISVVMYPELGGIYSHYHSPEETALQQKPHFVALEDG